MTRRATDAHLIEVAIAQFGRDGMNAVGTRAIADAAGLQMSAITYHFGGKEGLYLACAKHIAQHMNERIAPVLARAESSTTDPGGTAGARAAILAIVGGFVTVMTSDEVAPLAGFVVREQMNPTPAFEILYEGTMRRVLTLVGDSLQRIAGGVLGQEEMRIRALALLGQVFVFRFGRAVLLRTTGWESVGALETEAVRGAVLAQSKAILTALEEGAHP